MGTKFWIDLRVKIEYKFHSFGIWSFITFLNYKFCQSVFSLKLKIKPKNQNKFTKNHVYSSRWFGFSNNLSQSALTFFKSSIAVCKIACHFFNSVSCNASCFLKSSNHSSWLFGNVLEKMIALFKMVFGKFTFSTWSNVNSIFVNAETRH